MNTLSLPSEWKKGARQVDGRRLLYVAGGRVEAEVFAATHFVTTAKEAIERRGAFYVALSGGATPHAVYAKLAADPYLHALPWDKVHLFWSDERCVPPTAIDSNYRMAMTAGLRELPIPEGQIHRMHGEEAPAIAAEAYAASIAATVPDAAFDLILLGMGDDGHTASLFPGSAAAAIDDGSLVAANHVTAAKSPWRLTLTFSCIAKGRQAVFYALGATKAPMLAKVLAATPPGEVALPAQRVGSVSNPALWIVDREAASLCQ